MREGGAPRVAGLSLAIAVVIAACGGSARAATTYDTWQYTVSIPNDLGITPLNVDPAYIWAHPGTSFTGKTGSQGFAFGLSAVPACDHGTMLASAQSAQSRNTVPNQTEPEPVTYGSLPAAVFTTSGQGPDLVGIFACSGTKLVYVFAGGVKRADMDAIMSTFRFRDPPGDAAHPPAAATSR